MHKKSIATAALVALTLALCVALCASAIAIYAGGLAARAETGRSTLPIYTREGVGSALLRVSPIAALWLAAVAATLALRRGENARKPARPAGMEALRLLSARVEKPPFAALRERRLRRIYMAVTGGLLCALTVCALVYLLDHAHFTSWDLEQVTGDMLRAVAPLAALGFAALCLCAHLNDRSRAREIGALRQTLRANPAAGRVYVPYKGAADTRARVWLRAALYAVAIALVIAGVLNGGMNDVLIKAINICTECIGLG